MDAVATNTPNIFTQTGCSQRAHDRLKADTAAWLALPFKGYQTGWPATNLYEMRLCSRCGSSLLRAVQVVEVKYVRMPRMTLRQPAPARGVAGGRP